jgi:lysyl-tRNA synthetase class 1
MAGMDLPDRIGEALPGVLTLIAFKLLMIFVDMALAEEIQAVVYEIGRREQFLDTSGKSKTKDGKPGVSLEWFNMLYQVLLGQEKGPRFGSFVAIYGVQNTVDMIDGALARSA